VSGEEVGDEVVVFCALGVGEGDRLVVEVPEVADVLKLLAEILTLLGCHGMPRGARAALADSSCSCMSSR